MPLPSPAPARALVLYLKSALLLSALLNLSGATLSCLPIISSFRSLTLEVFNSNPEVQSGSAGIEYMLNERTITHHRLTI